MRILDHLKARAACRPIAEGYEEKLVRVVELSPDNGRLVKVDPKPQRRKVPAVPIRRNAVAAAPTMVELPVYTVGAPAVCRSPEYTGLRYKDGLRAAREFEQAMRGTDTHLVAQAILRHMEGTQLLLPLGYDLSSEQIASIEAAGPWAGAYDPAVAAKIGSALMKRGKLTTDLAVLSGWCSVIESARAVRPDATETTVVSISPDEWILFTVDGHDGWELRREVQEYHQRTLASRREEKDADRSIRSGQCSVCHVDGPFASIIPEVNGASWSSNNETAWCRHGLGKRQGNASLCQVCADAISEGLRDLFERGRLNAPPKYEQPYMLLWAEDPDVDMVAIWSRIFPREVPKPDDEDGWMRVRQQRGEAIEQLRRVGDTHLLSIAKNEARWAFRRDTDQTGAEIAARVEAWIAAFNGSSPFAVSIHLLPEGKLASSKKAPLPHVNLYEQLMLQIIGGEEPPLYAVYDVLNGYANVSRKTRRTRAAWINLTLGRAPKMTIVEQYQFHLGRAVALAVRYQRVRSGPKIRTIVDQHRAAIDRNPMFTITMMHQYGLVTRSVQEHLAAGTAVLKDGLAARGIEIPGGIVPLPTMAEINERAVAAFWMGFDEISASTGQGGDEESSENIVETAAK